MDGWEIGVALIQILFTVIFVLVPIGYMMGRVIERLDHIEDRISGNGHSLPGECRVHKEKLGALGRRVEAIEDSLR